MDDSLRNDSTAAGPRAQAEPEREATPSGEERRRIALTIGLGLLGSISGALSWLLVDASDAGPFRFDVEGLGIVLMPIGVYPGLVFGLLFAGLLGHRRRLSWWRGLGYVVAATFAYVVAFHAAFYLILGAFDDEGSLLACIAGGLAAGLTGSLLLGLSSWFLLRITARLALRLPVAIGTVAGALLGLTAHDDKGWGFLAFFVLWQGAYGASLAWMLPRRPPG